MARALLIFNPLAARTDLDVVSAVSRVFAEAGWELDVAGTTRPGHAAELARAGAADGVDLVAVYGGDGTTMTAVEGLVGSEVPVGVIPGGTGNLLAGNLRLPRNPVRAARVAIRGTPRRLDLGRVDRAGGSRHFAVNAGTGFDAQLMAATTAEAKRRWGLAAYVTKTWQALGSVAAVRHRITVDGEEHDVEASMVLVANCAEIVPPVLRLRRDIAPDDGWLDVVVANAGSRWEGLEVLWHVLTGRASGGDRLWFARGKHVRIETAEPRPVQLDGDLYDVTPLTAEIVPGALHIVVPRVA